jgi:tryptophanase
MERGTISTDRDPVTGEEIMADLELARLAVPRRTYTMSHIEYAVDRIAWLYKHREMIHGLKFVQEPPVLRFFFGRLAPVDNWAAELAAAFKAEFGEQM